NPHGGPGRLQRFGSAGSRAPASPARHAVSLSLAQLLEKPLRVQDGRLGLLQPPADHRRVDLGGVAEIRLRRPVHRRGGRGELEPSKNGNTPPQTVAAPNWTCLYSMPRATRGPCPVRRRVRWLGPLCSLRDGSAATATTRGGGSRRNCRRPRTTLRLGKD